MAQLHKKFSGDQIKILFKSYEAGHISRREIEQTLGIGKTRFFCIAKSNSKGGGNLLDRISPSKERAAERGNGSEDPYRTAR